MYTGIWCNANLDLALNLNDIFSLGFSCLSRNVNTFLIRLTVNVNNVGVADVHSALIKIEPLPSLLLLSIHGRRHRWGGGGTGGRVHPVQKFERDVSQKS